MFTEKIGPYSYDPEVPETIDWLSEPSTIDPQLMLQHLVDLNQRFGYVPEHFQQLLANKTGLTKTEIRGVIDFFHLIDAEPTAQWVVHASTNITDIMLGQQHNIEVLNNFAARNPGLIAVKQTSCTGLCDVGPALLINGFAVPSVSPQRLDEILAAIESNQPMNTWPTEWFSINTEIYIKGALLNHQIEPGHVLQTITPSSRQDFMTRLEQSELKGRGGAGFPTAIKWKACMQANDQNKVIVCNADEGEPGTFKDRVLLDQFLDNVLEGMAICARVIGAKQGYIYLRKEYLFMLDQMQAHIERRLQEGSLTTFIDDQLAQFPITIHIGAGAYICGEESAMLDSMEGKRGIPRIKPPLPVDHGLMGKPTVVNNVETFCNVTLLADKGLSAFIKTDENVSTGSKLHSISGDCTRPGIYEFPLGTPVSEILDTCGASDASLVQIGGAAGYMIDRDQFDIAIDYTRLHSAGAIMVFNESRKADEILTNFAHFFAEESCGFCTPCRGGTHMFEHYAHALNRGDLRGSDIQHALGACDLMMAASHCGLGKTAGSSMKQILSDHVLPTFVPAEIIAHD
ncbi:NAD-reducing hydrogenase HoxS subunit alpha [BD1-7 clade bacterium]|uniref:NADH-quinone oxidoreductase subunit F n=1 Tax=BD1-7 clade bacterium TaxID=2029982 RepID=A0A5S9QNN7_9GAMM|nr:NAD-reducing hydrogenase HoxS subunit alpha [BD1-7 clade bacterium]